MYVQIDPRDSDVMYANMQGGNLFKVDRRTVHPVVLRQQLAMRVDIDAETSGLSRHFWR